MSLTDDLRAHAKASFGGPQPAPARRLTARLRTGDYEDTPSDKLIATIEIGPTTWRVRSRCGVVNVYSSRDGCMTAMNSAQARAIGQAFADALATAADSVDRATAGGER